jgi:positive regulator of sigma E activity
MENLSLYFEKISNYSPLIVLIIYLIYYVFSNSVITIIILVIGIYVGFYLNNFIKENLDYYRGLI